MAVVARAAKKVGIPREKALELFQEILKLAQDGQRVHVHKFGTFFIKERKERTIYTPQVPGGVAKVPKRRTLRFKPSPFTTQVLKAKNGG